MAEIIDLVIFDSKLSKHVMFLTRFIIKRLNVLLLCIMICGVLIEFRHLVELIIF